MGAKNKRKRRHHERVYRSLFKTITYRVVITLIIFGTTLAVTHTATDALQVTGITAIVSSVVYYLHERAWAQVKWGRVKGE